MGGYHPEAIILKILFVCLLFIASVQSIKYLKHL